jgi:DNA-binding transcriptional LysR family regulator
VTGTTTRVLLVDDNGWVLGTTSGSDVTVDQGDYGVGVETPDGVFLIHLDAMSDLESHLRVQVGDGQKAIPAVPAPAVERTDRPLPAPDRASADGRRLGECLDRAGWPKSYADLWQPVAYVKHGGSFAMLAVSAGQYGLCTDIQGRYRFVPMDTLPTATEPQELLRYGSTIVPGPGGHHMFVAGTVAPAAKAMTVRTSDGDTLAAAVRNGMWVAAIPTGPLASVLVKDANGKTLYDGPPVEVGK